MQEDNEIVNSKCPNCGSILKYDAETGRLKCESCDSEFEIDSLGRGNLDDQESDFVEALKKYKDSSKKVSVKSIRCQDCGASIMFDENQISSKCPFCGSNKTLVEQKDEDVVPIIGVVPFTISDKDCNDYFKRFIKSKFFAPNKFKKGQLYPEFHPIYVPLYTFDASSDTLYRGQKGTYYYVNSSYRDSNGHIRTSREKRTRWSPISGRYKKDFDDVLVIGNKQKNHHYIEEVNHYNFDKMEKFKEDFLLGYKAEKSSISLEEGFYDAKVKMRRNIESGIRSQVNADELKLESVNIHFSNITFKQIVVPVYNGIYTYNNKKYHFVVNGQTGGCAGNSPISPIKVGLCSLSILLVVALVMYIVLANQ